MLRSFDNDETGQALVEYLLTVGVLARAIVSSIRSGISSFNNLTTHDLVLGTCIFVALAFVTSRFFGHHR